jgi:hypothetical protein
VQRTTQSIISSAFAFAFLVAPSLVAAQPSGGPYGPIPTNYAIPKAAHVYYVAPDGKADAPGTTLEAPTTIESAISRVVTGDAIVMRGGTYRVGGLTLNQGITIQPYADEKPIIKGTRVAEKWEPLRNNVWRTKWDRLFPAKPLGWWMRHREGMRTPMHRFNSDMVFVDGELLQSVGWEGELDARSFFIDYEGGYVYIGTDPANKLVEITAHDIALLRTSRAAHGKESDKRGPTIKGLTFTQYAYRAIDIEGKRPAALISEEPTDDPIGVSDPAAHGKEVVGTLIENVTVSFCSRVGGYFRGDNLVIRNSLFSDTSTEGIYVIGSSDVLLERNIVRRNNIEKFTGYYPAAVKIFNQSYRVTVRDNLILDNPNSNGVWFDVGDVDAVVVDNWFEGAQIGLFFEISKGMIAAGNVFVNCDQGVRVLNSSRGRVYHNTFVNSAAVFDRNERSAVGDHFGWHPKTGPDVHERVGHAFVGNLMVADESFRRTLLRFEQPKGLCGKQTEAMATAVDHNVYVRARTDNDALYNWSPVEGEACQLPLKTLADAQKLPQGVEKNSRSLTGYSGTVFKSPDLRNYTLAQPLPGVAAVPVPAEALKVLGWKDATHVPGAYALPAEPALSAKK